MAPRTSSFLRVLALVCLFSALLVAIFGWPSSASGQSPAPQETVFEARMDQRLTNVENKLDEHLKQADQERMTIRLAVIEEQLSWLRYMVGAILVAIITQLAERYLPRLKTKRKPDVDDVRGFLS